MTMEKKIKIGLICLATALLVLSVWFIYAGIQEETAYQIGLRTGVLCGIVIGLSIGTAIYHLRRQKE